MAAPRLASDSRSPAVPAGGPSPTSLAPRRASGPGSGAESPSSRDMGRGRKGGRPLARHAPHVRGEPGAKPFVDDLLLGRGFVRSRAAPSLRPSTQGFVKKLKKKKRKKNIVKESTLHSTHQSTILEHHI